jgi:cysteine-rich repeat protein
MTSGTQRRLAGSIAAAALLVAAAPSAAVDQPPTLTQICSSFFVSYLPFTSPRPCVSALDVTPDTTLYFELEVPTTNSDAGSVDENSVTATLSWGTQSASMLGLNQTWGTGYSGRLISGVARAAADGTPQRGVGFYIRPGAALLSQTTYTVSVSGQTRNGLLLSGPTSWSFTTRAVINNRTATMSVNLASPTVNWKGRWFAGQTKVGFSSRQDGLEPAYYAMVDDAHLTAPEFMAEERLGIMGSYWSFWYLDGDPNIVRERETRRVVAVADEATDTVLTLGDLAEGPLFGIAPGRPLSPDFQAGNTVLVCEGYTPGCDTPTPVVPPGCPAPSCERTSIQSVDDATQTVRVARLSKAATCWNTAAPTYPADSPATPDNFPYAYLTLRKLAPAGTPVYYWSRLDDEIDVQLSHDVKPQVNFAYTPLDLCDRRNGPGNCYGGVCANDYPKDWLEWDGFVATLVQHLIDRYGNQAADWYYSMGNEQEIYGDTLFPYYDYTINAVLRTFEQRLPAFASHVRVGGMEYTGLFAGIEQRFFYHASPTANAPGSVNPPVEELNYVCANPAFNGLRSARVAAICTANGNHGVPMDFVSIHSYLNSATGASRMIGAKQSALAIDSTFFANLAVNSFESSPGWVVEPDPDARETYRWGTFYPSWAADYFTRLLQQAASDPRYANGESTFTTWASNPNFTGLQAHHGTIDLDVDGNGCEDTTIMVAAPVFRFAELADRMSHDLAPLPALNYHGQAVNLSQQSGVTAVISGWRSREPNGDRLMLYAHDPIDTGSRETGSFDVTLNLTGLRWTNVRVTEYRLDRTHPARATLDGLGQAPNAYCNSFFPTPLYPAASLPAAQRLALQDDLVPASPPAYYGATNGALTLKTRLYSTGVVFLAIDPYGCGDGIVEPGETCDDGNLTNGDCCSSTCQLEPAGPACPLNALQVRGSYDTPGTANATNVAVVGTYAYLVTDNSSGSEFYIFNVSDPAHPALVSSLNIGAAVNAVSVEGSRAYLATSGGTKELVVIDVSNKAAPVQVGTYDANGTHDGIAVYGVGSRVYLGTQNNTSTGGPELYILDTTNPAAITLLGSYDVGGDVNGIDVNGDYAYLATGSSSANFLVLNVANPASPTVVASYDAGTPGRAVAEQGGRLVGVTNDNGNAPDFFLFTAPTAPYGGPLTLLGSANLGTDNTGVALYGYSAFVTTKTAATGLRVVDISAPAAPVVRTNLATGDRAQHVAVKDSIVYLATYANTQELQVAWGGINVEPTLVDVSGDGQVTTACLGDTNTQNNFGFQLWCQIVDGLFTHPTWRTVNRGSPGGTVEPGLTLYGNQEALTQLDTTVNNDSPDAVVLALGTADIQFGLAFEQNWGVPFTNEPIVEAYRAMKARAEGYGLTTFIALTPPHNATSPDRFNEEVARLNNRLRHDFPPDRLIDFHAPMVLGQDYTGFPEVVNQSGQTKRGNVAWHDLEK